MDFTTEKMLHGGDYNPEQWLDMPEILEKDIEFLKKAKINCVTLGIFSWSKLEPEEGVYDFDWLENIINRLYKEGISTILATPSAARPKWMADKYPEVLRVNEAGNRYFFGGRHNHCYTSPVYRKKTYDINKALAERFADNPAVILWHISNELGGECYCNLCQEEFRKWVEKRYKTVENLNSKWCTQFWSHTYNSFSQVEAPSKMGETSVMGLTLDWRRFVTERTMSFFENEKKGIADGGSNLPVTANFMYNFTGLNYYKLQECMDIVSWDNYPTWHKGSDAEKAVDTAMQHDILRSIKRKPFLLMESCPGSTNWQSVSKLKKPGLMEAASLQAVAHGSDSVLYFQIRQSRGATEKFHGAVIDHYGETDTRTFHDVCDVGNALEKLKCVTGAETKAEAAVIYDIESRWAMENSQGPRNKGLFYQQAVLKPYEGLRNKGFNVDLVDMEKSIDRYRIVIAPMLYMLREDFEKKIRKFVADGGIFVLTYWSGVVDENDRCFLGGRPYDLMDVMGFRATEIDGLYDGESNTLVPCSVLHDASSSEAAQRTVAFDKTYSCDKLCELIEVKTAKALMNYGSDFYAGTPVVTVNQYGKGQAYYVGADAEQDFWDDFCDRLADMAEIKTNHRFFRKLPKSIELSSREKDGNIYVFCQNFAKETAELILKENPDIQVIYKSMAAEYQEEDRSVSLPEYATIVFQIKK